MKAEISVTNPQVRVAGGPLMKHIHERGLADAALPVTKTTCR
jgi:hypothetical protein